MNDEEEISQEEIAKMQAKNRIVGVAIQHYLQHQREGEPIHCSICGAVKAFDARIAAGVGLRKCYIAALMEYIEAEFITNKRGMTVRPQKPKDRRPAITRFLEMTERVNNGDDYCLVWRGGNTFRVDDDMVTTPARFIYQEITGETLLPGWRLVQTCKMPHCIKASHREARNVCGLIR